MSTLHRAPYRAPQLASKKAIRSFAENAPPLAASSRLDNKLNSIGLLLIAEPTAGSLEILVIPRAEFNLLFCEAAV